MASNTSYNSLIVPKKAELVTNSADFGGVPDYIPNLSTNSSGQRDRPDRSEKVLQSRLMQHQLQQLSTNYKLTPATLAHKLNPRWIAAPHLMYISLRIAQAIRKGNGRIIMSMPPRHGKSELITKYTTIWALEHFPHWDTILATYGAELSNDFGREVRDIIKGNEEYLDVRIAKDASRAARWKTPQGGGMASVGIGGAITGRGANILLIDDYIKEVGEALSKSQKDYIWEWFVTVALTRLEPGGTCIIIATRWAWDDLIGRILELNPGGRWENIELPAVAGPDDLLGRQEGEALFPERYDEGALHERRETLGSFWFNALFQQRPEKDSDALTNIKWLRTSDVCPDLHYCVQARIWDLAASVDKGDWTAGAHMAYNKVQNSTWVTNMIRRRLSPQAVEVLVRQTAISDGTDTTIYIEQEPGASGKALVEHYASNVLPEFKVVAVPHNDGKLARAQPFLAGAEAGRVYLVKGSWNQAFLDEFEHFPEGDHDDQIDTVAIGYTKLTGTRIFNATWGRRKEYNAIAADKRFGTIDTEKKIRQKRVGIIFGRRRRNDN